MQEEKIIIVGAGLAGLVAAIELEKAGFKPTILEASDRVGGRVKTDVVSGFLLDHGFQVLLTAYPEAKRYLDFDQLQLNYFDPGALIFMEGQSFRFSDPLRQPTRAIEMLLSPIGTFSDKIKIFKWTRALRKQSVEKIFAKKDHTAMELLKHKGFSDGIIEQFFQPFFGGIFLENELNTSSRMLEFVMKMFSEGYAAIPAEGMGAIPKMLANQLSQTNILYNQKVTKVGYNRVELESGEKMIANAIIIATNPEDLMPQVAGQFEGQQTVTNLYFESDVNPIGNALIGLVVKKQSLINNFCLMNNTAASYAPEGKNLFSVSVNNNQGLKMEELQHKVMIELKELMPELAQANLKHIKTYFISNALPVIDDFQYSMKPSSTKIQQGIYLAGDYLLNGSINAAMLSGRMAAQAVYEDTKGKGFRS
ncbi:FAD-dependent oxidoreductase [Marivirga sp. S37H4]|uniref:FAD-dependent oxidoreductase n=1 Tax=Marivirga aurantiaca TaxID=2802615 RepID=A0A934WX04_9BACT|nr:NAD(P)/FAD-dependent oxidoreductase [Marivirga aurantiaca]MBK6264420.1 FAD-dependent oxidoreductase [Marivirga aurantiaca]